MGGLYRKQHIRGRHLGNKTSRKSLTHPETYVEVDGWKLEMVISLQHLMYLLSGKHGSETRDRLLRQNRKLKKNYINTVKIQRRAQDLTDKYRNTQDEAIADTSPLSSEVETGSDKNKFPVYKDFEMTPGEQRRKQDQKDS
ncbi:hypothetical protein ScPMuIL_006619 [Solemya velum]